MSNPQSHSSCQLPSFIASATPNPAANRQAWYRTIAPTYAGIFLWFVFWQQAVATEDGSMAGSLSQGLGVALIALLTAALICHFFFYLVPGLLGMRTGLPLYIVGTSTFGAKGGLYMPGFLMGGLQFGWVSVHIFFSSIALSVALPFVPIWVIMIIWGALATFVGFKGIQYVARVATYLPLIPLVVLLILLSQTIGGLTSFDAEQLVDAHQVISPNAPAGIGTLAVLAFMLTYVVGFFATAGAAGVDLGTSARGKYDVQMGGLIGITLAIMVTAGLWLLIVAGAYGSSDISARAMAMAEEATGLPYQTPGMVEAIMGRQFTGIIMPLLALAAFPPACFSAFLAANSFKTTLPNVNPTVSVSIGATISIVLALTGLAGKAVMVFQIIGASFGPICGAMFVDYLMSGRKWPGPRAGFNPAGWIAWSLGFIIGILPILGVALPAAPVAAFITGAAVYYVCSRAGLKSATLPLPKQLICITRRN